MKLRVYQQGGGLIYTPFIPEKAGVSTAKTSKSGDEDDAKLDPLDKELLSLMKDENLLPSDIQAISNALIAFQRSTQHLSDTAGFGGTGTYRSVMPGMLQIMNMVSTAKFNKNQWDKAISEMQKHDAGAEVAMDSYGRMFVLDSDGKLSTVSPKDFNPEKYQPISNSQLLQIRERSAGMDGQLLNSMADLVGKQDVYKAINEIIKAYGTKENAQLLSKDEAVQNVLIDVNSPEGIYKLSTKYPQADLQKAFKVLYDELPTNMQNLLKANAALSGESNPTEGAYKFIHSIIMNNINTEVDPSYDATASKAAGTGAGSGEKLSVKDTYAEHLNTGEGFNPPTWTVIQPSNSDLPLYAYSQNVGAVLKDEKRFETANLSEVLSNADAIGAIVDANNISFGDQLLALNDFSKVVYDASSNMKRVYLPIKTDSTGHIRIDFEAQQKVGKLQEYLDNHGEIAFALIEEKLEDIPNSYLDREHKVIRFKNEHPFLAINGIVSSDKVRIDTTSNYIWSMDRGEGDTRKDYKSIYNNTITTGYESGDKKRYDNGSARGKNLYEGVIYMPLIGPLTATGIFNSAYFTKDTYTDITQKAEARQQAQKVKTNFTE